MQKKDKMKLHYSKGTSILKTAQDKSKTNGLGAASLLEQEQDTHFRMLIQTRSRLLPKEERSFR